MSDASELMKNPVVAFVNTVFMGIGQCILSGNALSGVLIVVAIAYSSWEAAVWFVGGAVLATIAAQAMGAPKELTDIGMFSFAGAYGGVILGTFVMMRVPNIWAGEIVLLLVMVSIFVVPVTMAFMLAFAKLNISSLALPVLVAVWLLMAGFLHGGVISHLPAAGPEAAAAAAAAAPYTWETFVYGTLNAFGQVFMHGNPVTGGLVLLAVVVNSRIMALMAVAACLMTIGLDWFVGFPTTRIADGELIFNSFLTAMALGGFLLYLDYRSIIYAMFGALLSQLTYIAADTLLKPLELPAMMMGFLLITIFFSLAAQGLSFVTPVPLEKISKPENCILKNGQIPA
jgi:urea transporter